MTNEAIFYLIGCFLGFVIGYSVFMTISIKEMENAVCNNEQM